MKPFLQADVSSYLAQHDLPDILHVPETDSSSSASSSTSQQSSIPRVNGMASKLLINADTNGNASSNGSSQQPPPVPPRSFESKSFDDDFFSSETPTPPNSNSSNSKLEDLLIDQLVEDDFNPRAFEAMPSTNGLSSSNYQLNNNGTNGQITAGAIFTQTNGVNAPPLRKYF